MEFEIGRWSSRYLHIFYKEITFNRYSLEGIEEKERKEMRMYEIE